MWQMLSLLLSLKTLRAEECQSGKSWDFSTLWVCLIHFFIFMVYRFGNSKSQRCGAAFRATMGGKNHRHDLRLPRLMLINWLRQWPSELWAVKSPLFPIPHHAVLCGGKSLWTAHKLDQGMLFPTCLRAGEMLPFLFYNVWRSFG